MVKWKHCLIWMRLHGKKNYMTLGLTSLIFFHWGQKGEKKVRKKILRNYWLWKRLRGLETKKGTICAIGWLVNHASCSCCKLWMQMSLFLLFVGCIFGWKGNKLGVLMWLLWALTSIWTTHYVLGYMCPYLYP